MDIIKSVIHWILTAIAMTLAALIFLIGFVAQIDER